MWSAVPVGFRFQPTDAELVSYYLSSKVNGQEESLFYTMPEANPYAEEPWQIWDRLHGGLQDSSLYFFAIPKKHDRRTKSGTWSEGEPSKHVRDDVTGDPIGTKRKFRFETKEDSSHHAAWQMEEFSSNFSPHWVLCHLRKNKPKNNNKNARSAECIKPNNNKRSRGVETVPSNDPSTSTEMPLQNNNKRLRTVGVENTDPSPSPSSNSYFETELLQCSTTTGSITDNSQQFTMGEIFDAAKDLGDSMPICDVEWDLDNLLKEYEDYMQKSSLLSA